MLTIDQQIEEIQKEIRKTPYHKGTERHLGLLKAKIAKLKAKREAAAARGSSGRGISYAVKKQGDATIVLVGPPSVGKSTLINLLTNAESRVAPYSFTTVSVIPGMMKYRGANLQILDVPGLIEGAEEGKGRGREVLSVVRGADLLILITDVERTVAIARIRKALERNGIRIDKVPPQVRIEKKMSGGVIVHSNLKQELSGETIKEVAREMGIKNAEIYISEMLSVEQLVDAFARNRVYVKSLVVINKSDVKQIKTKGIKISAEKGEGIERLKKAIWEKLGFVTVYLVKRGEEPSTNNSIIMKQGDSLQDVAETIGSEFAAEHKKAKLWGNGAKFPGQEVSLSTKAQDQMMVRFI